MTGLQKFIMDLQKVAETGDSTWNSTYDFAKGVGIKQERERVLKIAQGFATTLCKCDSCNTAKAIAEEIKGG